MTFFDIHRGKLRRTYVHANDVSWTPGTYAFSEQRSGGGLTRRSFLTDEWGLELEDEEDGDQIEAELDEGELVTDPEPESGVLRSIPQTNPLDQAVMDAARRHLSDVGPDRRTYEQCALCRKWRPWCSRQLVSRE